MMADKFSNKGLGEYCEQVPWLHCTAKHMLDFNNPST